jgi:dsRNA-specific ribonuclease
MERSKRDFPFKETLVTIQEQCPRNLWRQGCDDHEELMATLGAILRDGNPKVQAFAEELLKKGSHDSLNLPRRKDSFSFVFPKPHPQPQIVASGKDVSAIKEFGDRIGEIPQYRAISVSEYPPCFEVVLQFNGNKFVGRGGSKPKARQEAAFKACRKFVDSMRQ